MAYDRITLNNGLRIIGERMEAVHTVAVGVFVRTGAVNEAPAENGYSHFVEHMVFKGTKDKDAAALADEMDRLGGATNAFTTKESTCFYTKVLQEDLGRGIRLLQDLILHPEFPGRTWSGRRASSSRRSPCARTTRRTWSTSSCPTRSTRAIPWACRSSARRRSSAASPARSSSASCRRTTRPRTP